MTTNKTHAVVIDAARLMLTSGPVTLDVARELVGRTYKMPTLMANEQADFTVKSVSQNRETGDVTAWMASQSGSGRHVRIVAK